jgi:DNA (cytosine-5)-methyltransferase 1
VQRERSAVIRVGSLFSGIGGLELGLERAGLGPVLWQAESDPFCRRVLERHWPGVRRFEDVREVDGRAERVDVLCGGFPCQDISQASHGGGGGIHGARSGLWGEIIRIADELRPRWVVAENVSGSAGKVWVPIVRRALWSIGYASVPIGVSAAAVGAPFAGDRIFLAATYDESESARALHAEVAKLQTPSDLGRHWRFSAPWDLGVDDGVPNGVDRRRACGNAVVPQVAEVIGRAIVTVEAGRGAP